MDDCESVFIDCLKDACKNLVVVGGKTAKREKHLGNPMGIHSTLKIFFKLNVLKTMMFISHLKNGLTLSSLELLRCMELACNIQIIITIHRL